MYHYYDHNIIGILPGAVTFPPSIAEIELRIDNNNKQILLPGDNATGNLFGPLSLTCNSNGVPTPKTLWQNDNGSDLAIGRTLLFEELTIADRGFYHCNVTNAVNTIVSEKIQVIVNGD